MPSAFCTIRAQPPDKQTNRCLLESLWKVDAGHRRVFQTECSPAGFAMEMRVLVVVEVSMPAPAQFIPCTGPSPIFNDMDEVMSLEKRKHPENARLVDGEDFPFQLSHRHRLRRTVKLPCHNNTVCCHLDSMPFKHLHILFAVHLHIFVRK